MIKFTILVLLSAFITKCILDQPLVEEFIRQFYQNSNNGSASRLFTEKELATYNGQNDKGLFLSIIGNVYDVTRGVQFYGKRETYHIFVGRDNSRSFVTGNLGETDVSDKVIPLTQAEFRSLNHWAQFYKKEYPKVGKLIGRYYNSNGKLTQYGKEVKLLIREAELAQTNDDAEKLKFPPCNIEWEPKTGTKVWCTKKSGGIERDWVGVPRELYEVGAEKRCACIHEGNKNLATLKEYEGCHPESTICLIINDQ